MDALLKDLNTYRSFLIISSGKKLPFMSGQELYNKPPFKPAKKAPKIIWITIKTKKKFRKLLLILMTNLSIFKFSSKNQNVNERTIKATLKWDAKR